MEIATDLELSYGGYIFAKITRCRVSGPSKTFTGVEFTFNLQIEPTNNIEGRNPRLERLVVDIFLIKGSAELFLGQLKDRFIDPSSINYSRNHQQFFQLHTNTFLKLVDETHNNDLELKLRVQAVIQIDTAIKNSSGGPLTEPGAVYCSGERRLQFPHSDWLKIINNARVDFFDLVTLRTNLRDFLEPNAFTHAFGKLHEAQNYFNRGDWNAVGSTCRNALSTVLSLAAPSTPKIKNVLSSVISNPQRETFGIAAEQTIDKIRELLNYATHQGGNAATNAPPADLKREDALLTLHLTAAAISYIAGVYKQSS